MDCLVAQEALSAQLDGEDVGVSVELLDAHLRRCTACRQWSSGVVALHRQVRVQVAQTVPDLTPTILAAIGNADTEPNPQPQGGCRVVLALCALLQLAMTLPVALAGSGPIHLDHELGAWDLALSIGFLVAAARPARAWGMLPIVGTVVAALIATAGFDIAAGNTTMASETGHIVDLLGLGFLWMTARSQPTVSTIQAHLPRNSA